MKPMLLIILALSIAANVVGLFGIYKAVRYRQALSQFKTYNKQLTDNYEKLKNDFPGISTYADDNLRLMANLSPAERKKMTVMFGASITKGFDASRYLPGKNIVNRGVGSQSHTQLLARFSDDVLQLEPGQAVIKFCSGNFDPSLDSSMMWDEYEMMALTAQWKGIRPLLATILPATRAAESFEGYSMANNVKIFNDKIRGLAAKHNFQVVDYYKAMADADGFLPDSLAKDEIHPNEKGYEIMAKVLSPLVD
jgi:lysophospholipase L1-like esterase